jgi:hypothetical protein
MLQRTGTIECEIKTYIEAWAGAVRQKASYFTPKRCCKARS